MSMKGDFAQAISLARKNAHLTQECAAEALGLSRRVLVYYEAGEILPCDEVVAKMMQVYGSKYLGYAYLSTASATGQLLLPKVQLSGIASSAMQLRVNLRNVFNAYDSLETICADDVIAKEEADEYNRYCTRLESLISASMAIKLQRCKQTKKSLTAATVRP